MSKDDGWIWAERIFKQFPLPYPAVSAIIGLAIYFGYVFFGIMIHRFPFPLNANLSAIDTCIMIACEFAGMQYFINIMKKIFSYWSSIYESANDIYIIAVKRFTGSHWYYLLVLSVIIPFYLIDWIYPTEQDFLRNFMIHYLKIYGIVPTIWGALFDIYLQLLSLIGLFFLAILLWIMANIAWTLQSNNNFLSIYSQKATVFSIKMKVSSIRDLILKVLTYYFICITLAVLSYLNPVKFYGKETFLLLVLLLIGILFFFAGLNAIQRVLKNRVEYELDEINRNTQEQIRDLNRIAACKDYNGKSNELNHVSSLLDAFQKQREQCENIDTNLYNISSVARFIGSLLLPSMTGAIKSHPELVPQILNNLHNMINYLHL